MKRKNFAFMGITILLSSMFLGTLSAVAANLENVSLASVALVKSGRKKIQNFLLE